MSSDRAIAASVVSTDPVELREQAEILGGLEAHAARLAAGLITADELAILRDLTAEMEAAVDGSEIGAINNRFHLTIAAASGNRRLVTAITQRRAEMYSAVFALSGVKLPLMLDGDAHAGIVDALETRAGATACERMWEHHRVTMDAVLSSM